MKKRFSKIILTGLIAPLLFAGAAQANFSSCVAGLKSAALRAGVDRPIAEEAFKDVKPDEQILRLSRYQPEFKTPIWDYFARLVDEERIADGRAKLKKHDALLRDLENKYGVDRHVLVALWGVETDFGKEKGSHFLPHALANLACNGRRAKFFRQQLITALTLVDRGHVKLDKLYGSWAGAFGHTQFIPTTYRSLAVDHDGDGKRNLVESIPDALASTANYLRRHGWTRDASWMIEVRVPDNYRGAQGRTRKAALSTWARRGVVRADGAQLSGVARAGLILPAGPRGPGFLVFKNFDAIYAYNRAESYALAISYLADRIAGYPALRTPWPTDDEGLTRSQRVELQRLLAERGYYKGELDGKFGPMTTNAMKKAQAEMGLPITARAGMKFDRALGGK